MGTNGLIQTSRRLLKRLQPDIKMYYLLLFHLIKQRMLKIDSLEQNSRLNSNILEITDTLRLEVLLVRVLSKNF